jgi:hypothetical protein
MRTIVAFSLLLLPAFGQFNCATMEVSGDTMTVTLRDFVIHATPAQTGLPYSDEVISEHMQTLADGTHLSRPRAATREFRDSQGRVRTEKVFRASRTGDADNGAFVLIGISDPGAGFYYVLDDVNKVVHRLALTPAPERRTATRTASGEPPKPRTEASSEKLGTHTIEGLLAEGHRETYITPVGVMGNDRPLVRTYETWYAPELRMVILSKMDDPVNGVDTTHVVNISRAEPDPSLFIPPADYSVVDEKDSFSVILKRQ